MKILKSIIPQRIKTKEQLAKFVETKHTPAKIFGMEFRPRFVLNRDVDVFMTKLAIPENTIVRYTGKGNYSTGLQVGENATFRAQKAGFKNPVSNGRFLRLRMADGDLAINKGSSKVKVVTKTATHYSEGTSIIGHAETATNKGSGKMIVKMSKTATNKGPGKQIVYKTLTAEQYGTGPQIIKESCRRFVKTGTGPQII